MLGNSLGERGYKAGFIHWGENLYANKTLFCHFESFAIPTYNQQYTDFAVQIMF